MEFVLEPINITRELILSRVSEETLMEHYAGAPCKKGLFVSKLRRDVRPTCAYYRSNKSGRLIYKDFGDNFAGDFVSVVMYKFNCSYYKALIEYSNTKFEITKDAAIQVEIKDFEQYELDWWARYGITEDILKKFKVYSCKNVFLNGELFHAYKPGQYMFGYYGGNRNGCER